MSRISFAGISERLWIVNGKVFESPKVIPPKSSSVSSIYISGIFATALTGIFKGFPPLILTIISAEKSLSIWDINPTVNICFDSGPILPLAGVIVSSSLEHSTWKIALFLI